MTPSIEDGDWLLVDPTVGRWPRRGTVVVFREPGSNVLAIKRVAGRPGDWIPFADGWLRLADDEAWLLSDADDALTGIRIRVRNTGRRAGIETVQAYFRPAEETEPVRLIGWAQVALEPDSSASVTVHCDPRMLRRWDEQQARWRPLGAGVVLLARGLGDVRVTIPVDAGSAESRAIS